MTEYTSFLLIILGFYLITATPDECFEQNNGARKLSARKLDWLRLVGGLYHLSTIITSRVGCLQACTLEPLCKGFNYARSSKTCELKSIGEPSSSELIAMDDFVFYSVSCVAEAIPSTVSPTTDSITTDGLTTDSITTEGLTTDSITTDGLTTDSITTEGLTSALCPTTVGEIATTISLLPPPAQAAPNMQPTVILFYVPMEQGMDVFIRGGRTQIYTDCSTSSCSSNCATDDPCSISITHISPGTGSQWDNYNAWRDQDNYLDHFGREDSQGFFGSEPSEGTPLALTSNDYTDIYYNFNNQWGPDYWMFDGTMDCSQSENGWIYFKGVKAIGPAPHTAHLEVTGTPDSSCTGSVGGTIPSTAIDGHYIRCGYLNKVAWGSPNCEVNFAD
ncbi:unnamed protein product [Owenia fusiformis]|uniref:Uncharacterized protein n=1 Tax=Owenia fusiformis TaxID=6347 RepID=A0A8J1TAV7_OWEFU|nr:unnamed protein product [Owenia fusiformis]